ncbi:kinase domain-containing protein [Aspergillus karnatakaensis]|uniref:kinase domain-containing protein n=1 Tax=Aspergillus karnatakaensis TaxID=1810916 RepID=UPI003CCCADAF
MSGMATEDFADYYPDELDGAWAVSEGEEPDDYDVRYGENTFYPISIGEVIHDRYLIEHKIGWGGFAVIWMAHDLQDRQDVALKVFRAGKSAEIEIQKQDIIRELVKDTSHLVTYLQKFEVTTNTRCHQVLVLPLRGPCIDSLVTKQIPVAVRMSAAKQLLEALGNLHKADIVHRADKYKIFGRPRRTPIPEVELEKPGEYVSCMEMPEHYRTNEFFLADFGLARRIGDKFPNQTGEPPRPYLSPERYHEFEPSFACDMWSYMTVFAELYCSNILFEWKGKCSRGPDDVDWVFDQSLRPNPAVGLAARLLQYRPDADQAERELVQTIMLKVFRYRPEERLTAFQLLQDPDFQALMARYGC